MNTNNSSPDFEIQIPEFLGGGRIVEEDYTPTYLTGVFISRALGVIRGGDDRVEEYLNQQKMPLENLPEVEYSLAETSRILSPIKDSIEASRSMDREVTDAEMEFLSRYNRVARALGLVTTTMTTPFYLAVKEERQQEIAHADRAQRAYEEREQNPVTRQQMLPRIMTIQRGDVNPDYWHGSVGRRAVQILDIVDTNQPLPAALRAGFTDAFTGIAALDMSPLVDDDDYKRVLRRRSARVLGLVNSEVATESRQPKAGGRAHPRHTTGDGMPVITRNRPGV